MQKFNDVTPEETSEMQRNRDRLFGWIRTVSMVQLGLSPLFMSTGIVMVIFSALDNRQFPFIAGGPIYSGLFVLLAGIFAQKGLSDAKKDGVTPKSYVWFGRMHMMNSVGNSLCVMSTIWGIVGIVFCASSGDLKLKCMPHDTTLLTASILATILGLMLVVSCAPLIGIYYRSRKTLFGTGSCKPCK